MALLIAHQDTGIVSKVATAGIYKLAAGSYHLKRELKRYEEWCSQYEVVESDALHENVAELGQCKLDALKTVSRAVEVLRYRATFADHKVIDRHEIKIEALGRWDAQALQRFASPTAYVASPSTDDSRVDALRCSIVELNAALTEQLDQAEVVFSLKAVFEILALTRDLQHALDATLN